MNSSAEDLSEEHAESERHDEDSSEDPERMQTLAATYGTYRNKCTEILGAELFDKLYVHLLIY